MVSALCSYAMGALAWLLEGEEALLRRARADGSYASAQDPRLLFALGEEEAPRAVRVRWLDGSLEDFAGLAVDRYHVLRQGTGVAPEGP